MIDMINCPAQLESIEVVTDLSSCLQQNDYCSTNEGLELFATYKVRMYSCNAFSWMEWLYGIF
jgi:hypothetical protein